MILGLSRSLSSKPSSGVRVNYAVAGPSLYGAWLLSELGGPPMDVHTRQASTLSGAPKWSATDSGVGLNFPAISDFVTLRDKNTDFGGCPTSAATIFILFVKTDATLRASHAFATDIGGSRISAHIPYSDGTVYWDFGGTVEGTSRLSVAGLTTSGLHLWCLSTGPRGMEIWQDGLLRATNTGTPTRTNNGLAFTLGVLNLTDLVTTQFLAIFSSQLSGETITRLSKNPYSLFLAQRPSGVYLSTVNAGTTITGLGKKHMGFNYARPYL